MQAPAVQRLTSRQPAYVVGQRACLRQQRRCQRLRKSLRCRAEVDVSQQTGAVEKSGPDFKPLKDVQAIMDVLPHR